MQPLALAAPTRQDLGTYSDTVSAPQPLGLSGPMAQGHLTITETQDADLILSQASKTNMHEVPSYYSFLVNNTTLECLLGSKSSGQRPPHLSASPPEYIAKQVPSQPDSYSKQEPTDRTLWHGTRKMVSLTRLIVHFAIRVPISQSASPNHLRIEKLEGGLRLCQNFMKSPLNEMLKTFIVLALDARFHGSSAFWIAGTEWGNRFSNHHHLDTNILLILLLLVCAIPAFLMMHCNKSSLKAAIWPRFARPMCDGFPFASSPFRRLANRGSSFRGFPFRWTNNLRSLQLDA